MGSIDLAAAALALRSASPIVAASQIGIWAELDRLVERAPRPTDLLSHGLGAFAARRWRTLGRPVPEEFVAFERRALLAALTAPILLRRVREAYDGPLLVLKGPEVSARYPDRTLRGFSDVDLLAADPEAVHRALLAAGAVEVGDPELYLEIHHLRPVGWPDLPLFVEVHSRPKWVAGLPQPTLEDVFEDARVADVEVDGFLAPSPARHALLLAAHSWGHAPLRRLRDLVDIAAIAEEADRAEIALVAREWGIQQLWSTTLAASEAVLAGGRRPASVRIWARHLGRVRGRTVLENHLQRWLSDFWIRPFGRAALGLPGRLVTDLRPEDDEGWRRKLRRTLLALRNAARRQTEHDDELERGRD